MMDDADVTERLKRITVTTEYVWNSKEDAKMFLHAPHPLLGGQIPLDIAASESGGQQVERLLWRIFYGTSV